MKDAVHHLYLANHFDPRHEEWHYYLRSALQQYGAKLKQDGKPEEALQQYREAVRLYPDDADARYNLGVTLVQQGKLAEVREQFLMALWLSPNDPAAASNLRAVEQLIAKGKS